MSAVKRAYPCHATANAPTTRYSTLFAFNDSINSRKLLLSCIGVESLPELEHHGRALLRGQAAILFRIGGIRFAEAVKNADYLLHAFHLIVPSHRVECGSAIHGPYFQSVCHNKKRH